MININRNTREYFFLRSNCSSIKLRIVILSVRQIIFNVYLHLNLYIENVNDLEKSLATILSHNITYTSQYRKITNNAILLDFFD